MVKKCLNSHYYDGAKFSLCPYCGAGDMPGDSHNDINTEQPMRESDNKKEQRLYVPTPKQDNAAVPQSYQRQAAQAENLYSNPADDYDDEATIPLAFLKPARQEPVDIYSTTPSKQTPPPKPQKSEYPETPAPRKYEAPIPEAGDEDDDDATIPLAFNAPPVMYTPAAQPETQTEAPITEIPADAAFVEERITEAPQEQAPATTDTIAQYTPASAEAPDTSDETVPLAPPPFVSIPVEEAPRNDTQTDENVPIGVYAEETPLETTVTEESFVTVTDDETVPLSMNTDTGDETVPLVQNVPEETAPEMTSQITSAPEPEDDATVPLDMNTDTGDETVPLVQNVPDGSAPETAPEILPPGQDDDAAVPLDMNTDTSDETVPLVQNVPEEPAPGQPFAPVPPAPPAPPFAPAPPLPIMPPVTPENSLQQAVRYAQQAPVPQTEDTPTVSLFGSAAEGMENEPPVGWLIVISGAQCGKCFELKTGRNFIGSAPGNDIVLGGDSSILPLRHAMVLYEPRKRIFFVQPGGSELISLNGEVIFKSAQLKAYDRLTAGSTKLLFFPLCGETFAWDDLENE